MNMLGKEDRYRWWLHWLKVMGVSLKLWKSDVMLCPKSWQSYFDEGYTISEAIAEDLKYK